MKRTILCLLALMLLMSGFGCKGADKHKSEAFTGVELETILEKIYETADLELPDRGTTTITQENAAYYLGTDIVTFTEGVASEALISAIPFSLCLIRVPEKDAAAEAAEIIRTNANPNKWVCVGVSSDHVITDYAGDVVILIMAEQSNELRAAFNRIATES